MSKKELETTEQVYGAADACVGIITGVTEAIAEGVTTGYKSVEAAVVTGYKSIEEGVVEGFGKVVDACVEVLFTQEGESVEDAKARLSGKSKEQTEADE